MSDLISRQAVENITWEEPSYTDPLNVLTEVREKVRALPSVENKGKWKRTYLDHVAMGERPSILYCSVCHQCIAYPTNYCPNCGADMRQREE